MRCYKSIITMLLSTALMLSTGACGKATVNNLMRDASPVTSALSFYVYDGEKVNFSSVYESSIVKDLVGQLNAVEAKVAKNWTPKKITLPVYGVQVANSEGRSIFAAWSNGYWIAQDGTVYRFDFDFAKLEQECDWQSRHEYSSTSILPCARLLCEHEKRWDRIILTPSAARPSPDGITMSAEAWDKESVTVKFINNSNADLKFGNHFDMQVLLDDTWYDVPTMPGDWGFEDIAYYLLKGEERSKTYNLFMYGDLPAGTYRLVTEGFFVEGTISE